MNLCALVDVVRIQFALLLRHVSVTMAMTILLERANLFVQMDVVPTLLVQRLRLAAVTTVMTIL